MSILSESQKVLIIRYGKKIDCIEKHQEVIDKLGYCWFGKIGVVPGNKAIAAIQKEEHPCIILYSQGKGYLAQITEISFEKPNIGYPQYYDEELFGQLIYPKSYYRLISLDLLDISDLKKLKIVSSGRPMLETVNRSMSSFFLAEYGNKSLSVNISAQKEMDSRKKADYRKCVYMKDGICLRKGFVNYKYACERPSNCAGQKQS